MGGTVEAIEIEYPPLVAVPRGLTSEHVGKHTERERSDQRRYFDGMRRAQCVRASGPRMGASVYPVRGNIVALETGQTHRAGNVHLGLLGETQAR